MTEKNDNDLISTTKRFAKIQQTPESGLSLGQFWTVQAPQNASVFAVIWMVSLTSIQKFSLQLLFSLFFWSEHCK